MFQPSVLTKKDLNSPITSPIEVYFSGWHLWGRVAFGAFWILLGALFSYIIFFLATEKSTFGVWEKVLFSLVFPLVGFFWGIRPAIKMFQMKTPRLILHSDKVEFFDTNPKKNKTVYWNTVRQIGYRWYDDGGFASTYELNLEVINLNGATETVKLNVKGLNPDKDWIYQKIQNHFKYGLS